MNSDPTSILKWQRAATELGIEFVAPFTLSNGGEAIEFPALVPEFGSAKGMLIMFEYSADAAQAAQAAGYGFSCLSKLEANYDVRDFADVLNDWGWARRDESAPAWYTGAPWTT